MITEEERNQLKRIFQGHYTEDVSKILNKRNILNRNGLAHNAKYIRMVFQGIRKNSDIEDAILHLASIRKKEMQYQQLQKTAIFKKTL